MTMVVSMGSSSSSFVGRSYVMDVAVDEIMHVGEVGYSAACLDSS